MAILYVNDGGSDTSPYDTWAKAANLMASALADAACVAGSTIYLQSDHVETYSADTTLLSANGTSDSPITIISVTNTNEPPEAADIQTMTVGGGKMDGKTNGAYDIRLSGYDVWIGLEFIAGDNLEIPNASVNITLINCKLIVDDILIIGTNYSSAAIKYIYFENVDVRFVTSGSFLINGSGFYWKGGSFGFDGGSTTNLFNLHEASGGWVIIEDIDIQDLDSSDYLVSDISGGRDFLLKRCKVPAAANYMNSGPIGGACKVRFHSVDNGNFIHRFNEYYFEGNIMDDVATYRNSAATYDGTNEYSVKLTSNANAIEWSRPLRFKLADIWCAANPTIAVELNTDNVVLQNDEFWIEIEYPDSTIGALGKIDQTSRPATILTTPANLTTSSVAWTEAFGTEKPQKIEETILGGQAGIHTVWACLGKPSTTVYVCPKMDVS